MSSLFAPKQLAHSHSETSFFSNGAPASPATQHSPLHLDMLQINSFDITSSETRVFSIEIKRFFYKNKHFKM